MFIILTISIFVRNRQPKLCQLQVLSSAAKKVSESYSLCNYGELLHTGYKDQGNWRVPGGATLDGPFSYFLFYHN